MKQVSRVGVPMFVTVALLFSVGLMMGSCGTETIDNFNSAVACSHYCDKKFECLNADPSNDETNNCIHECRDTIENQCGNENQAAANDKIEECVDQGCNDFWACMVFEAAPECLGFVNN
jgi:hypothetical protein